MTELNFLNLTSSYRLIKKYITYVLFFFLLNSAGLIYSFVELSKYTKKIIFEISKIEDHSYINLNSNLAVMRSILPNAKVTELPPITSKSLLRNYLTALNERLDQNNNLNVTLVRKNSVGSDYYDWTNYRIAVRHYSFKEGLEELNLIHNETNAMVIKKLSLLYSVPKEIEDIARSSLYNGATEFLFLSEELDIIKKLDELSDSLIKLYKKNNNNLINEIVSKNFKIVDLNISMSKTKSIVILKVSSVFGFALIWFLMVYILIKFKERSRL